MPHLLGCKVKCLVGVTWHKPTPRMPRHVPVRDVATGKRGGSRGLTEEAEGLTLIFIMFTEIFWEPYFQLIFLFYLLEECKVL